MSTITFPQQKCLTYVCLVRKKSETGCTVNLILVHSEDRKFDIRFHCGHFPKQAENVENLQQNRTECLYFVLLFATVQ